MNARVVLAIAGAVAGALAVLAGCNAISASGSASSEAYRHVSQDEALSMMEAGSGYAIVDVRRQDEYDAGHIPGAILVPNETIGEKMPEALPDLEQVILVYCRSGNRSKQA
ncbi:MAG: rhodanese-like domain-containing protein, partial [Eggerthellaceae bacterium]|nr:rhodanese-like domain-containing protein [Eggerthellaceae bacterium]